jgi:hypothetical protein
MLYSRAHKSRYFCGTCHDVSNPVLANLGLSGLEDLSGGLDLISEQYPGHRYFHIERTFSEFMLSDYGRDVGAPTNPEFQAQGAPDVTWAARCQDCHMRDVVGVASNKSSSVLRPDGSTEHPNSGLPLHDLTGGNSWISRILASLDPTGPVYDPTNAQILGQGAEVLTLDLSLGESPVNNGDALFAGSERARQQLLLAATIRDVGYPPGNGTLTFKVQNNTGHKLISGFPEGRRMFVNVKAWAGGQVVHEVNPYDDAAGTLRGLEHAPSSPPLGSNEVHVDELVYEVHPSSDLTGEEHTFHFVLATGRYKDNRIPPRGFDSALAAERIAEPVWDGHSAPDYFTPEEYAGGYDEVWLDIAPGAEAVEITLYYQGTSREYVEFLRDEINGTASSLTTPTPAGLDVAYLVQTDPFFTRLRAWGDAIWDLWSHNHGLDGSGVSVDGIVPFAMSAVTVGDAPTPCTAPTPSLLAASPGNGQVTLEWEALHLVYPGVVGYRVSYDQAGKTQLVAEVGPISSFTDTGLTNGVQYCYVVTSLYDADGDGAIDCESEVSNLLCAVPNNQGQASVGITSLSSGSYVQTGKGKSATIEFVPGTSFAQGKEVIFLTELMDASTGLPVPNVVVSLEILGPEPASVTSDPSTPEGIAEARWQTAKPNKKGIGGTATGDYLARIVNVVASGYDWDGASAELSIQIVPAP